MVSENSGCPSIYVFANGELGSGPFGFQADIFDSAPGDDGYSPLRSLNLVTWSDEAAARTLGSVAEVEAATNAGELSLTYPGVVVNMPISR